MRRRDALRALVMITVAGAAAGCGDRPVVRVAAVWSGWELTRFRKVIAGFPGRDAWQVEVLSAGNDLPALIGDQVAGTAAPDIAMVSQPSLIGAEHRDLVPMSPAPGAPQAWERLLTAGGQVYGAWFKAAHKSLVWYRPDLLRTVPQTWEEWVSTCRALAAAGHAPLAIGAADGWVLADWFANALLAISPATYQGLIDETVSWRHPNVAAALGRLAEIWSIPGAFPGGPARALVTQYDESVLDVFRHGHAAMVAGADFYFPIIRLYGSRAVAARWFRFPCGAGEQRPLVVGGDAAVLLEPGGSGGRALIEWLTAPEAASVWAAQGGFLSLDPAVHDYPAGMSVLADDIRGGSVTFGLSDQLGGRLSGADGRGTWKIFKDFFAAVAERPSAAGAAIPEAVGALDRASRGRP
ncbi:MAG: alpha-glucoside transport system substrate-binding protein [Streptosporangiaceae bacterium]|jgi:alpha-glucoside transport system substrate-binding protein|nr:alpha-glucoside transport system substrate-binding protein [Streptosporangiaceae bacterium]